MVFDHKPWNNLDAWNRSLYDLDLMTGHPINLQIVGTNLEEEKVLGAAMVIERVGQLKESHAESSGLKSKF